MADGEGLRCGPDGVPQPHVLFFPSSAVEVLDTWHSGGLRGSDSADFTVQDVFVPDHRVCLMSDPAAANPVYRMPFGTWGRPPSLPSRWVSVGPLSTP